MSLLVGKLKSCILEEENNPTPTEISENNFC